MLHQEEFYKYPQPSSVVDMLSFCLRECLKHANHKNELGEHILPFVIFFPVQNEAIVFTDQNVLYAPSGV